jgi:type II secretory pathway predicted ATPase ExeA
MPCPVRRLEGGGVREKAMKSSRLFGDRRLAGVTLARFSCVAIGFAGRPELSRRLQCREHMREIDTRLAVDLPGGESMAVEQYMKPFVACAA